MSYRKHVAAFAGSTILWRGAELFHKRPRILFYHGVETNPFIDLRIQANQMQFSDFEKQIIFLRKYYKFLSIDELYSMLLNNEAFTGKEIVITFDDGYKNNYSVVAPYLKALNIPFTVFISTRCIENGVRVPTYYVRSAVFNRYVSVLDMPALSKKYRLDTEEKRMACNNEIIAKIKTLSQEFVSDVLEELDNNLLPALRAETDYLFRSEELMSWDEAKDIALKGGTIGSHSMDHAILHANQSEEVTRLQLAESKRMIESYIGKCNYFAYPNGDKTSVCELSVGMAGQYYRMNLAVDGRFVSKDYDMNFVSRIGVCDNFNAFRSQLSILSLI